MKIGKIRQPENMVVSHMFTPPYYIIQEDFDDKVYSDITTNVNWIDVGIGFFDYLYVRKQIKERTTTIGFESLHIDEQKCAARHFVVSKEDRLSVFTEVEEIQNWEQFIERSLENRLMRASKAKSYISYKLQPIDSIDLALKTENLMKAYIEFGIESQSIDGVYGIYDWLNSEGIYSGGTGFNGQTYYSDEYKTNILNILQNGFY